MVQSLTGHLLKSQLAHKMTPCTIISAKNSRGDIVLNQDNGQNKKYLQTFINFSTKKNYTLKDIHAYESYHA